MIKQFSKKTMRVISLGLVLSALIGMATACWQQEGSSSNSSTNDSGSEVGCAHQFANMELGAEHLAAEATAEEAALYYYSCIHCGENGTSKFFPDIEENREVYTPSSFTMTMYETVPALSYGMTWNSLGNPVDPVVTFRETGAEEFSYVSAQVTEAKAYALDDTEIPLYVVRAVCPLEVSTDYEYKVGDLASGVYTQLLTMRTVDPTVESFKFSSLSDTQSYDTSGLGNAFDESKYMRNALTTMGDMDFYLHSGDILEISKYENYWANMLNNNLGFLSKTPLMMAAGNHGTVYQSAEGVFYDHFNYNLAVGAKKNIFYSFDYGNAKFIVIDTNVGGIFTIGKEQYLWLSETLKNNTQKWTIVIMHCPMYSAGKWGSNPDRNSQSLNLRSSLSSIFAQYGVDLVIQGHDHVVSKTHPIDKNGEVQEATIRRENRIDYSINPDGTIYIMNGPGGNGTRYPESTYEMQYYDYVAGSYASSWGEYTIEGNKLTVHVKYYDETKDEVVTMESFGIIKEKNEN